MPETAELERRTSPSVGTEYVARRPARDLLDYFDRTFVINLPERTDRRRDMERELARFGFLGRPQQLEFFPACRVDDAAGFPCRGSRGCFLSHLEILRRAQATGLSRVLIMEDDLAIAPELAVLQPALLRRLEHDDWDMAYLGYAGPDLAPSPEFLVPYQGVLSTTHFYAVRGRAIAQLVAFLEAILTRAPGDPMGGPMHVDGAYQTYRDRNPAALTLLTTPNLGTQRSTRSDIHPAWWDRIPVLRSAAGGVRWLKRRALA